MAKEGAPVRIDLKDEAAAREAAEKNEPIAPNMIRGVTVEIGGRTIPLLYNMRVQLQIEEELGMDFSEINEKLKGKKNTRTVISMILLMGNAGLKKAGQAPDLTEDWLIDHIKPGYTTSYRIAAMGAVTAGWFMETDTKDDTEQDDILAEIRKKNGNTD